MNWRVAREFGLKYGPAPPSDGLELSCPTLIEPAGDGQFLVVDELAVEKCVPIRIECRTLLVDRSGRVAFDSRQRGMTDAYGRALGAGRVALLRRSKWEITLVASDGTFEAGIGLWTISKRMPRQIAPTPFGGLLVLFLDRVGEIDLVEIDLKGRLLWRLREASRFGAPGGLQKLHNGHVLFADEVRHLAVEVAPDGSIAWSLGRRGDPSAAVDRLSSPRSIQEAHGGERVIADTRNHRILGVEPSGRVRAIMPRTDSFTSPSYSVRLDNGNYLVADTGNRRALEVKATGDVVWEIGHPIAVERAFSFPRSIEPTIQGGVLIADTGNNRLVETNGGGLTQLPAGDDANLFWPRAATRTPRGSIVIADGRNSRIVELAPDGRVIRELNAVRLDGATPFDDPHDVRALSNDRLLIVDAPLGLVVECDWEGEVHRVVGRDGHDELKDPHSAQPIGEGRWLIADTGNDRLLVVGANGRESREISGVFGLDGERRLHRPRFAHRVEPGVIAIADTGHNRILAMDDEGRFLWEVDAIDHPRLQGLDQPRWLYLLGPRELLVCDHYHHRILHLVDDGEGLSPPRSADA